MRPTPRALRDAYLEFGVWFRSAGWILVLGASLPLQLRFITFRVRRFVQLLRERQELSVNGRLVRIIRVLCQQFLIIFVRFKIVAGGGQSFSEREPQAEPL